MVEVKKVIGIGIDIDIDVVVFEGSWWSIGGDTGWVDGGSDLKVVFFLAKAMGSLLLMLFAAIMNDLTIQVCSKDYF